MASAEERNLIANGLSHHVVVWGTPPVDVVLCHGFLDVAWSFDAVAGALVDLGYRVAAFDWRGHGESDWIGSGGYYHFPDYLVDLDDLLPQLSDAPVHLVGHSMGGSACAMYAAVRPERLRSLTLIEGIGPPDQSHVDPTVRLRRWLNGVQMRRAEQPKAIADHRDALRRMRLQNPRLGEELGLFLASKTTKPTENGELQWSFDPLHRTWSARPFSVETFGHFLRSISLPTLAVAGERGYRLPDEASRLAQLKDCRLVEIADVGHMIHWFKPVELAKVLVEFFANGVA